MIYLINLILFTSIQFVQPTCLGSRPIGEWHDVNTERKDPIPEDSIQGGYDHTTPLFICRAFNYTIKMKYVGKSSRQVQQGYFSRFYIASYCWVEHEGKEKKFSEYQILTAVQGIWLPVFNNKDEKPCNSLKITEMNGEDIFSGRKYDHPLRLMNVGAVIGSENHLTHEGKLFYHEKKYEIFAALPRMLRLRPNETSTPYMTDGNFISFKVKRKEDMTLFLGPSYKQLFYEIIFPSDSTRFEFKDHRLHRERTFHYIDYREREFDGFWIYFRDNNILVGTEGHLDSYLHIDTEVDSGINTFRIRSGGYSTLYIPHFEECF